MSRARCWPALAPGTGGEGVGGEELEEGAVGEAVVAAAEVGEDVDLRDELVGERAAWASATSFSVLAGCARSVRPCTSANGGTKS